MFLAPGFLGVCNPRLLVYGAAGARAAVQDLAAQWSTARLLDDWFLQPSRIPYSYETGEPIQVLLFGQLRKLDFDIRIFE